MPGISDEINQEIQNEILPEEPHQDAVPVTLNELKPWHRPRKQFIRCNLWMNLSRQFLTKEKNKPGLQDPAEGKPEVRYLTLPGIDYLDVKLLADVCREFDCSLTSIGFLSGDEKSNPQVARAKISEFSLIRRELITNKSITHYRRLEEIASESQAKKNLERSGPFHIVNIDACGSIAPTSADHSSRLIDAIYRIVEFQMKYKSSRWLLFLTTDVRSDSINPETFHSLLDTIKMNAKDNEAFREKVTTMFCKRNTDITSIITSIARSSGEKFLKLFALSFSKWLIHLAKSKNWTVKTHRTYCYSSGLSGSHEPTMVSLGFEFVNNLSGLHDSYGVVNVPPATTGEADDTSVRAANKVDGMENVITKMQLCEELREMMKNQTKMLLEDVGYEKASIDLIEEL